MVHEEEIDHPSNASAQEETKKNDELYSIDHSIRGTAKCKGCRKVIAKNDIRIGKVVQFKQIEIKQYYHTKCSFSTFRKAKNPANTITDVTNLTGFEMLSDEEKKYVKNLIDEHNARIKATNDAPPKKIPVPRKKVLPPPKIRRAKLAPSGLPSMNILFTNADQLNRGKMSELHQRIITEKPLVIAVSEMKPKIKPKDNSKQLVAKDYDIPGYTLHPKI